ncbi:MAG: aminoglycoside phosphotransferase family protein [Frankia sp.]|nr:aminoglycoside phosphotransferase family protein [Frankia sp.]
MTDAAGAARRQAVDEAGGSVGPRGGGRFTAEATRRGLAEICAAAGVDDTDAIPIKLTVNAVYRLPRAGAVARIATSDAMTHRVPKVVQVARWLAEEGVPAVRLLPGVPAPVRASRWVATLWTDAGTGGPVTCVDLGRVLRRLHRLPPPQPPLPPWDPLDDVRRRLADAEALPDADRAFLENLAADVAEALAGVRYQLGTVVVHGDAHLGNLIRTPAGNVVICDFDSTCVGPAEWDLIPVAVGVERFGFPRQMQADLAATYGFDITRWDGYPVLRAVRELKLVTSILPILGSSPTVAEQFRVRLASLRDKDRTRRWSPYR